MSKLQHFLWEHGPRNLSPADVAQYHIRFNVGETYRSDRDARQASDGTLQIGTLQLILEALTADPPLPAIEVHGHWLREYYDRAMRAIKNRDRQIKRLSKMLDTSLLSRKLGEQITIEDMAMQYRSEYDRSRILFCAPNMLFSLEKIVLNMSLIKKPEDCVILKGVGKKKLEKIVASAKERKATKSK